MPRKKKSIDINSYLSNPDVCPFCGTSAIIAGDLDYANINAWRTVRCKNCSRRWQETFVITRVDEIPS